MDAVKRLDVGGRIFIVLEVDYKHSVRNTLSQSYMLVDVDRPDTPVSPLVYLPEIQGTHSLHYSGP